MNKRLIDARLRRLESLDKNQDIKGVKEQFDAVIPNQSNLSNTGGISRRWQVRHQLIEQRKQQQKTTHTANKNHSIQTIYNETVDSPLRPFTKQSSDKKYDAIFISELVDYMK